MLDWLCLKLEWVRLRDEGGKLCAWMFYLNGAHELGWEGLGAFKDEKGYRYVWGVTGFDTLESSYSCDFLSLPSDAPLDFAHSTTSNVASSSNSSSKAVSLSRSLLSSPGTRQTA